MVLRSQRKVFALLLWSPVLLGTRSWRIVFFLFRRIRRYELILLMLSPRYPSSRTWVMECFGAYRLRERIGLLKPAKTRRPFSGALPLVDWFVPIEDRTVCGARNSLQAVRQSSLDVSTS